MFECCGLVLTLAPAVAGYQLRFVASIRLKFLEYPLVLWRDRIMGVWAVFRGGLCKRWSCESLGDQLGFGYGAILKGLVAWGGGNSGGAPLGGVLWLGGWLVVAFLCLLLLPDIWCLIFWLKLASLFCL